MLSSRSRPLSPPLAPAGYRKLPENEPCLYTDPTVARFNSKQEDRLATFLQAQDAKTIASPIQNIEELQLLPDGCTVRSSNRYTSIGLARLSGVLSYGLWPLISEIGGTASYMEGGSPATDLQVAINIFNSVLSMRFSRVRNMRLLVNQGDRLIDGLIGARHAMAESALLYAEIVDVMKTARYPSVFQAAIVVGRRMSAWYRSKDPAFSVKINGEEQPFWVGSYFCNGDATQKSLKATTTLFNRFGGCLAKFDRQGREIHLGRNFFQRASRMFDYVAQKELPVNRYRESIGRLVDTSLGMTGSVEERDQRIEAIAAKLSPLSARLAVDIVRQAVNVGSDNEPRPEATLTKLVFSARSQYDLFCALLRTARTTGMERRETIERVAYDLMMGRIKL